MKRIKFFLRFDKEEKWLEYMAGQGWMLTRKSFFYYFREVAPKAHTIRLDYRERKSAKDFLDYCTLFEDSGWKHIAGTRTSGTQYFLKINDDSTEDIFSDAFSRAGRYKRLSDACLYSAIVFIPILISTESGGWTNFNKMLMPKERYFTPGLWELKGVSFWWAFMFETPFALMRGLSWLLPIIAMLICFGFAIKSRLLYRAETNSK